MAAGNAGKGTPIYKKDYTPLAADCTLQEDWAHLRRWGLIDRVAGAEVLGTSLGGKRRNSAVGVRY